LDPGRGEIRLIESTEHLDELFDAVRRACTPERWSRGIELARAAAVRAERTGDEEAVFHVAGRGGRTARTVRLFPSDADWECACTPAGVACEHSAAAVIAWKRARDTNEDLALHSPTARVAYRFRRAGAALVLERWIVAGSESRRLWATLGTAIAAREPGSMLIATQADLGVDLCLGTHRDAPVPRGLVPRLLARLAGLTDIQLDGQVVQVSAEPVLPAVWVEDQGDGFRLTLRDDPAVSERFQNGFALCGDVLRPVGDAALSGRELEELPAGKYFPADRAAELATSVVPSLRRRVPLEIRTKRLPDTAPVPPRIEIKTSADGETLSVLATLVYGDPPRARVDGDRLVYLEGPVPVREEAAERRLIGQLAHELGLTPGVRVEYTGSAAVLFAARLDRFRFEPTGNDHDRFRRAAPLAPRVHIDDTAFDVTFESRRQDGTTGRADPARVLHAWRAGASLVPLLDGGWAELPRTWLDQHGHRVADLLAARAEASGRIPVCSLPDLAALAEALDQPAPPSFDRLRQIVSGFDAVPESKLPADLEVPLRRYQKQGVDWLAFLCQARLGALLADDMGLGKTVQALCALRGRTLVVAPRSALHNWADEAKRFRPALTVHTYHGPGRALDPNADLTLTTYAILRLDADELAAEEWGTLVLDESQAIKNPESQVAAAAFRLQARFRVALTGTPVENRLDELWSQMHFLNPGLLGGRRDFDERYAQPIALGVAEAARRLRERIRPFVLRRIKSAVAPELPPRTDSVLRCELTPEERATYDAVRAATADDVVKRLAAGGSVLEALEALLRLRQAACHAGLVPGIEAAGSSKVDLLLESLDSVLAEGHKALVFSQWTSLLDRVEPALERASIAFTRLDGSTRDRGEVVRRFQEPDGPPVLLVSLKAGGTALNLTAADHVFLLDPWWNPAVEDQAADRAHRIGQTRPVFVYRLVAEETVEERILELQGKKRELARIALDGATAAAALTRDDLMDLLR
jgi:superfamily II DNA or RNA helicase